MIANFSPDRICPSCEGNAVAEIGGSDVNKDGHLIWLMGCYDCQASWNVVYHVVGHSNLTTDPSVFNKAVEV